MVLWVRCFPVPSLDLLQDMHAARNWFEGLSTLTYWSDLEPETRQQAVQRTQQY